MPHCSTKSPPYLSFIFIVSKHYILYYKMKFLIFCVIVGGALACTHIQTCINCINQKCQFAVTTSGQYVCAPKITLKTHPNVMTVGKHVRHCRSIETIQQGSQKINHYYFQPFIHFNFLFSYCRCI